MGVIKTHNTLRMQKRSARPKLAGPRRRLKFEFNALRERQLRRPVDGHRLPAHVGLPGIASGLPAAAGLLLAAERASNFGAARPDVDVRDPAIATCSA